MTTKLVSANLGIILVVERDGKTIKKQFSTIIPTHLFSQPIDGLSELCDFLNDEFGTEYVCYDSASEPKEIKIAKSRKIKARRHVSQATFNKKIRSLGYD